MEILYLGLGSNMGDRHGNLMAAAGLLSSRGIVRRLRLSGIWESQARYCTDQPDFLNLVACGETDLEPGALLEATMGIEADLGRDRSLAVPKGPRPIDIDILLFGSRTISEKNLTIPHPGMKDRKFVLLPLLELAPGILDPATGIPFASVLAALPRQAIYPWITRGYDAPYP